MAKYIKESFKELSRVSWPNFNTTVRLTIVVLIFSVLSAATIGAVDYVLNAGYKQVVDYTIESGIRDDERTSHTPAATTTVPENIEVTGENADGAAFSIKGVESTEVEVPAVETDAE